MRWWGSNHSYTPQSLFPYPTLSISILSSHLYIIQYVYSMALYTITYIEHALRVMDEVVGVQSLLHSPVTLSLSYSLYFYSLLTSIHYTICIQYGLIYHNLHRACTKSDGWGGGGPITPTPCSHSFHMLLFLILLYLYTSSSILVFCSLNLYLYPIFYMDYLLFFLYVNGSWVGDFTFNLSTECWGKNSRQSFCSLVWGRTV